MVTLLQAYPEESCCAATLECTVLDPRLFGQVLSTLDWRIHALHGQKGSQVGGVRRDHNQCEKPPDASNHACGECPIIQQKTQANTISRWTLISG